MHRVALRSRTGPRPTLGRRVLFRSALLLLSALALVASAQQAAQAAQQEGRWIHDDLRVDMRTGPSFENRIIEFLSSGTPVTVLETREDWIRIRTGDEEGWIQSQYTTDTPVAEDRLAAAQAELASMRRERDTLAEELTAARQEAAVERTARTEAATALEQARADLEDLRRTSANAVETAEALRALRAEASELRDRLQALEEENLLLATDNRNEGLKWGAGAVVLGIVLAMLVSAWGGRRRKSEWI
jgi:SH3 domain protein